MAQQCTHYYFLDKSTPVRPRWPFYREGYPTQVAADEMATFYDGSV